MTNTTTTTQPLLPNEARALVNATRPDAQDFQPVYDRHGAYAGYTFQNGDTCWTYGWLAADGTINGREMYRSRAEFDLIEYAEPIHDLYIRALTAKEVVPDLPPLECPECGRTVSDTTFKADEHHPKCPRLDPHF